MVETTTSVVRLDMFKAPFAKKVAVIRAKLLPKGLYGCELGPINESAMQTFRAATADCMTYNTTRRSKTWPSQGAPKVTTLTQTWKWCGGGS